MPMPRSTRKVSKLKSADQAPGSANSVGMAKDITQHKIVAAAQRLFLENGYAETSMDEISAAARVSKTTLYTRFPSKGSLFAAMVRSYSEESAMRFFPEDFDDLTLEEALRQIGGRFVDLVCSDEALRLETLIDNEGARDTEVIEIYRRNGPEHNFRTVEAYLRHAARRGLIEITDFRFAAVQFLTSVRGDPHAYSAAGQYSQSETSAEVRVKKVVNFFLNGIRKQRP